MSALDLQERLDWVGASEIAALVDASPFVSRYRLWHVKAGNIPQDDLSRDERVQAGFFLEPSIAAWANHKWGWDLIKSPGYTPHPRIAGMGASLDYVSASTGAPVDIKNIDGLIFRDPEHGWFFDGEFIVDAPVHYVIQMQAQMACTGARDAWLVPMVAGNHLFRFHIERHDALIARLESEVERFWQSIRDGIPPDPDFSTDGGTIARLTTEANGTTLNLAGHPRAASLCSAYLSAHIDETEAKARKAKAAAELRTIIGPASKAVMPGFSVTLSKPSEDGTRRILIRERRS